MRQARSELLVITHVLAAYQNSFSLRIQYRNEWDVRLRSHQKRVKNAHQLASLKVHRMYRRLLVS